MLSRLGTPLRAAPFADADFETLQRLVLRVCGIRIQEHRRPALEPRVGNRLKALGLTSYQDYFAYVAQPGSDEAELRELINLVTINLTQFFREPHHFDFLRDRIVPAARARFANGDPTPLRIWCAACSTGQEPYSIAMTVLAAWPGVAENLEILATDIDTAVLTTAAEGAYSTENAAQLPERYRRAFLQPGPAGMWRVTDDVRARVKFVRMNLTAPKRPLTRRFDAIFCRNTLIYFDLPMQRAVIERLVGCLEPDGHLLIGNAETLLGLEDSLVSVAQTVYARPRPAPDPSGSTPAPPRPAPACAPTPAPPRPAPAPRAPTPAPPVAPVLTAHERTRVLVVDDSALMRKLLSGLLATDPGIEVVGAAPDPIVAWEMIKKLRPHVLTLDVEMPRMDGISFLERLMTHFPMPVVMVSSRTEKGCATGMRALELGAVEIVAKPGIDLENDGIVGLAEEIVNKVLAARAARVRPWTGRPAIGKSRIAPAGRSGGSVQDTHVVAMGASTGGTEALREVLMALPADAPGIVVVQHMPGTFTRSFADRLDGLCQVRVKEAVDGDPVLAGHVLIAPGGWHMEVVRSGATSHVRIRQGPLVNGFRPSVDLLFSSCADQIGPGALGVILTGMGSDGAQGLRRMRDAGAHTIAQDEATCVVFGMPKAAIALGGAVEVSPIDEVAGALMREVRRERSAAKGPPLIVAEPGR